jgi:hypothetical protein
MKTRMTLALAMVCAAMAQAETDVFDEADTGRPPRGWQITITGKGDPRWTVETDASAPSPGRVLQQSGTVPRASFPLCIREGTSLRDGHVEVKFKAVSGKIDQAAGVIWRCQDENNYYICRANALEDNVVLYKVENGKRSSLEIVGRRGGYGVDVPVAPNRWHTLRVEFAGTRFKVRLNGKHLFEVEDTTFKDAGRVGLWTKADSVTVFDDFSHAAP